MTSTDFIIMNKEKISKVSTYVLPIDKRTTIGRSGSCHITIKKPEISSYHAVFYYEDDSFWLRDNDSANGTELNGKSVTGNNKLKFNDIIKIGDYYFTFVCEFVYGEGKKFFLEIGKKAPSKSEKTQKIKPLPKKKKSKSAKKSKKKNHPLLKSMGSDVVTKLRDFNLKHQKVIGSIKKFTVLSIICHLFIVYLLGKYIVDRQLKDDPKEIALILREDQPKIEIPKQPIIDVPEPEIKENVANPVLDISMKNEVNSSVNSLKNTMDDVEVSEASVTSTPVGVGDIKIGKGYKGSQDFSFINRLKKANGRFQGVDIRLTLIWDGYSDLDMHAQTPSEVKIFHGNKIVGNGELDVDKNASEPVRNPVENIIWDTAEDGEYTISVVLFDPRNSRLYIPFKVEFQVFGDVYYYKGTFKKSEVKEELEIVKFECRDGKYRIRKTINDRPTPKVREESLDLIVE